MSAAKPKPAWQRELEMVMALVTAERGLTREQLGCPDNESGRRTFERHKKALREDFGFDLVTVPDPEFPGRVRYLLGITPLSLGKLDFTFEEQLAIALASSAWRSSPLRRDANTALTKVRSLGLYAGETPAGQGMSLTLDIGRPDTHFGDLLDAVENGLEVSFDYQTAYNGRTTERTVQPWQLREWQGAWYLAGLDTDTNDVRIFRLSRIVSSVTTAKGRLFARPSLELLSNIQWGLPGEPTDGRHTQVDDDRNAVVAAKSPNTARLLQTTGWKVQSQNGEATTLVRRIGNPAMAANELASHGSSVEIIEPEELRDRVESRWCGALVNHTGSSTRRRGLAKATPDPGGTGSRSRPLAGRPAHAIKAVHLFAMACFIRNSGYVPIDALAARFNISRAQVDDDLGTLNNLYPDWDAPFWLETDTDRDEVVWHDTESSLKRGPALSSTQAVLLAAALDGLADQTDTPESQAARSAGEKLRRALGEGKGRLTVPMTMSYPTLPNPDIVSTIRQAITDAANIEISYVNAHGDQTRRVVEPMQLFTNQQSWYLTAWEDRTMYFRVDRIVEASVLPSQKSSRHDETKAHLPARVAKGTPTATVWVAPPARWRVESLDIHDDPTVLDDGSMLVRLRVADPSWLTGLALSLGPMGEVIEPPELRQRVADAARDALGDSSQEN